MAVTALDRTVGLTRSGMRTKKALRLRTVSAVIAAWDSLGSWRADDIARFTAYVLPLMEGAQRQTAAVTDAYLSGVLRATGAHPGPALDPSDFTGANVRNVDPATEWARPGNDVWAGLANGLSLAASVHAGRNRAQSLASTDLQLASTNMAQARLSSSPHTVGYERVPDGDNVCGLCATASTQRYHSGDLMPIHDNCNCSVVPIVGEGDPGRIIHADLLDQTRAAVRAKYGTDVAVNDPRYLHGVTIAVHRHGELGPVLTDAQHHFTGPAEREKIAVTEPPAPKASSMLEFFDWKGATRQAALPQVMDYTDKALEGIRPTIVQRLNGGINVSAEETDPELRKGYGRTFAYYQGGRRKRIQINHWTLTDAGIKAQQRDIKSGWHVKTAKPDPATAYQYTVNHELGHFLYDQLANTQRSEMWMDIYDAGGIENKIWSYRKALPHLAPQVSKYAGKDEEEFIAEAFAEFRLSPDPGPIAKAVGNAFLRYLGPQGAP